MDESQLKTLLLVALMAAFFLFFRRYLRAIYSADGRIKREAAEAARSAGVLPAIVTCLATLAMAFVCWRIPAIQSFSPWIIGATAMLGAIRALNAMTRAARSA